MAVEGNEQVTEQVTDQATEHDVTTIDTETVDTDQTAEHPFDMDNIDDLESAWDSLGKKLDDPDDDDDETPVAPKREPAKEKAKDTVDSKPPQDSAEKVADTDAAKANAPDTTDWKAEAAKTKAQYESFKGIMEKRQQELEELKASKVDFDRFNEMLRTDPRLAEIVYGKATGFGPQQQTSPQMQHDMTQAGYDYTDPSSVSKYIQATIQQTMAQQRASQQAEAARIAQLQFVARINANKAKVAAEHGVSVDEVDAAMSLIQKSIVDGNIPALALQVANLQKSIDEAEKRGAENARKKFESAKDAPKRVAASTNAKTAQTTAPKKSDWREMTPDERRRFEATVDDPDEMQRIWDEYGQMPARR